jgi:hypothetical protein
VLYHDLLVLADVEGIASELHVYTYLDMFQGIGSLMNRPLWDLHSLEVNLDHKLFNLH